MVAYDIATIGHFSIDFIYSPKKAIAKQMLGGPPTYVSLTARKLGAKVAVISKVGEDFPVEYYTFLKRKGVDLSAVQQIKGTTTTSYKLIYSVGDQRRLVLINRAPTIEAHEIPATFRAKIVHVAPIANEVAPEVVPNLSEYINLISLDPQGFLRYFKGDGSMFLGKMRTPGILEKISVFKASQKEIEAITGTTDLAKATRWISQKGVKVVIVTRGSEGVVLHVEGKIYHIPAAESRRIVDTTGAGDVFIGGFLTEFVREKDLVWSACVGSASASFVIEKPGPSGFGLKKQVYERAEQVYNRVCVVT